MRTHRSEFKEEINEKEKRKLAFAILTFIPVFSPLFFSSSSSSSLLFIQIIPLTELNIPTWGEKGGKRFRVNFLLDDERVGNHPFLETRPCNQVQSALNMIVDWQRVT